MGQFLSCAGFNRGEAIVVWDIENIPPPQGVSISDVLKYVQNKFLEDIGNKRVVCGLTKHSLCGLEAQMIDELVLHTTVAVASPFHKKRDADYVLIA